MKTMKFAAAFLMVAMVLASCGNSKSNESQETEQTPVEVFSVTPSESSSDEFSDQTVEDVVDEYNAAVSEAVDEYEKAVEDASDEYEAAANAAKSAMKAYKAVSDESMEDYEEAVEQSMEDYENAMKQLGF